MSGINKLICRLSLHFMRMSAVGLALSAVPYVSLSEARAGESDIRKDVIEDCRRAHESLKQMDARGRAELIPYLKLVLGLVPPPPPVNPPAAPMMPAQRNPLEARLNPSLGSDLLKSIQPTRELEAKRCAVEILEEMKSGAFDLVPDLIRLSLDKTLPISFSRQIDEAVWHVTLDTSRENLCNIVEPQLTRLFELLSETVGGSSMAGNVLIQTGDCSMPYLMEMLRNTDDELRQRILEILHTIDDSGALIGPHFIQFLHEQDADLVLLALDVLSSLRSYYEQALLPVLDMTRNPDKRIQGAACSTLRAIVAEPGIVSRHPLHRQILATLLERLEHLPPEERGAVQEGLMQFPSFPEEARSVLERLATAPEPDLRKRALTILGKGPLGEPDVAFLLRHVLIENSMDAEIAGIDALGRQPDYLPRILATLVQLLKSSASRDDVVAHQKRICAASGALLEISRKANAPARFFGPFIPFLMDAVRFRTSPIEAELCDSVAGFLAFLRERTVPDLVKLLKDKDPVVRLRALESLGRSTPLPDKSLPAILDTLSDGSEDVRRKGRDVVASFGKSIVPRLRKRMASAPDDLKVSLAEILIVLGQRGSDLEALLDKAVLTRECGAQGALLDEFAAIQKLPSPAAFIRIWKCLGEAPLRRDQSIAMAQKIPAPPKGSEADRILHQYISSPDFDPILQVALLKRALELGISQQTLADDSLSLLERGEDPVKVLVMEILETCMGAAQRTIPVLEQLMKSSPNESVQVRALHAIFSLKAPGYDYESLYISELGSPRFQYLKEGLTGLQGAFVVPFLSKALAGESAEGRFAALQLIPFYFEDAKPLAGRVRELYGSPRDLQERLQAFLALLALEPEAEETLEMVRAEVTGRLRENLLRERLSGAQKRPFVRASQSPGSFLEQQTVKAILEDRRYP